jgi:DNA-directed RNA polymerase subunit beta
VGTGIEGVVAKDSGVTIVAKRDGVVVDVDACRIVMRTIRPAIPMRRKPVTIYNLSKFVRSQPEHLLQPPPDRRKGQRSRPARSSPTVRPRKGELALGKNVTVAFMPWGGYNFEDSILVSEAAGARRDLHLGAHRGVRGGGPRHQAGQGGNHPRHSQRRRGSPENLDESGIIRLGAEVKPGDVLVGKITPKGETQLSPRRRSCCGPFSARRPGTSRTPRCGFRPGSRGSSSMPRSFRGGG